MLVLLACGSKALYREAEKRPNETWLYDVETSIKVKAFPRFWPEATKNISFIKAAKMGPLTTVRG